MNLKAAQTYAKSVGLYTGKIDGDFGPKTNAAAEALFRRDRVKDWANWPAARRAIAIQQLVCEAAGIDVGDIDGRIGPQTLYAFEVYDARQKNGGKPVAAVEAWRDKEKPLPALKSDFAWPKQADVRKFFGDIGANQTTLVFPYPMKIAWDLDTVATKTSCHEKVHDAALRVLTRVKDHYGDRVGALGLDLFGGCLNVRKMRGGSAWSMHSWGIAFDFDPMRNALKMNHAKAQFAKPDYERWFQLWEEEGAVSLGRTRDYDWMHTQFARP